MSNQAKITTLETALADIDAKIEAHFDAPIRGEIVPHKTDSKAKQQSYATRWAKHEAALDALTAEKRAIKAQIAALNGGGEADREFAGDIANRASAEAFAILKQRQLDGVLRSCGRL